MKTTHGIRLSKSISRNYIHTDLATNPKALNIQRFSFKSEHWHSAN